MDRGISGSEPLSSDRSGSSPSRRSSRSRRSSGVEVVEVADVVEVVILGASWLRTLSFRLRGRRGSRHRGLHGRARRRPTQSGQGEFGGVTSSFTCLVHGAANLSVLRFDELGRFLSSRLTGSRTRTTRARRRRVRNGYTENSACSRHGDVSRDGHGQEHAHGELASETSGGHEAAQTEGRQHPQWSTSPPYGTGTQADRGAEPRWR